MDFISYAQNFEDVVLWRALKGVNSGFYIDVGAADPEELSVTKAFYDQGWSGINLEPTATYFERLVRQRPRDLNLKVAAGAEPGLMVLHEIAGTGLSTASGDFARRHTEAGWQSHDLTVPVLTLSSICSSYQVTDIHFLKVDVEGAEASVLQGMDFSRFRPWVVLVEATEPLSSVRTDATFESLLLSQRYRRAYFDGLNAYYVAEEHAGLAEALALPPNVLDRYVTARQHALELQAAAQTELLERLSRQVREQDAQLALLQEAASAMQASAAADAARLSALEQERSESSATMQRIRLHADQLKRRLEASDADAARHERAGFALRAEYDELLVERHDQADRMRELERLAEQLRNEHQRLHAAHATIATLLDAIRVSTSWRLTRPMRVIGRAIKGRAIGAKAVRGKAGRGKAGSRKPGAGAPPLHPGPG